MKKLYILLSLLITSYSVISQCRVQSSERPDGVTVRYKSAERVGKADMLMLALSVQTNGTNYYVTTLSVFPNTSQDLTGKLTIEFTSNKSIILEHISSNKTTFNGYPATVSIFEIGNRDLRLISTSYLKNIILQLDSKVFQTVPVTFNKEVLKKQYNCLN